MSFLRDNKIIRAYRLAIRAFGDYKKQVALLIFFGFLSGLLESIGVTAIIPLFSFLSADSQASANIVTKTLETLFGLFHIPFSITYILVFIAVLFILKGFASFLSKYYIDLVYSTYVKNTSQKLFGQTIHASWPYLSKQKIGYLEKVLTQDINAAASMLTIASTVVILLVNTVIYITIAFNISSGITLITLTTGFIVFTVLKPFVSRTRKASARSLDVLKISSNKINESMLGIKTIKSMAAENIMIDKLGETLEEWKHLKIRISTLSNITNSAIQPMAVLLILALFAYSYTAGSFAFASFAVIIYAINKIFAYVQQAQGQLHHVNEAYPFLYSVIKYEEDAIKYTENVSKKEKFSINNSIDFENVSFAYEDTEQTLSNINLSIKINQITGIIGPSGSGKTTLVDLLLRLVTPTSGVINIDGKNNIHDVSVKKWREKIGYVSQDIFLFNDTIRNNISFYSDSMSEENIIEAAKMANIYDFIKELPEGLDTIVGERGTRLSGGQRQRIVLARVLALKPEILILDEATSSLDNESQALIQKSIEGLRGKTTIVIVAHRPSTVMNVDKLVVFKNGFIVEKGSPKEMAGDKESYFHKIKEAEFSEQNKNI